MDISKILIKWYRKNKRDLPWRHTRDPYKIWVSEIILQQTRVNQGISYYHSFLDNFPDIKSLAESSSDRIMRVWQGLGYYSRARNMHAAAKYIVKHYHGTFPEKYEDILKLKGVGKYTAAAISSLAYNYSAAAVDSNVIRTISRIFAIHNDMRTVSGREKIDILAGSILDVNDPGEHNQAMIELGALICTPGNPKCELCPVNIFCKAFKGDIVHELPVKYVKKNIRVRFFYYYIITANNKVFIQKRTQNDIWNSLYEFPLYESSYQIGEIEIVNILKTEWKLESENLVLQKISPVISHVLSHQRINARFIHVCYKGKTECKEWETVSMENLNYYAFPVLLLNYIKRNL